MKKSSRLFSCLGLLSILLAGCSKDSSTNGHIDLGMTKKEVMNKLGDPNYTDTDKGRWYYFDTNFSKKYNQMNEYLKSENEADIIRAGDIYEELTEMHFTYRFIQFSLDGKAIEYFYDTNHRYNDENDYLSWERKQKSDFQIKDFKNVDCYRSGETYIPTSNNSYLYEVSYQDNSIYKGVITPSQMTLSENDDKFTASWTIFNFDSFTTKVNINVYDGYVRVQYASQRCSVSGSGLYNSGDVVNLSASLNVGYVSGGWYDAFSTKLSDNSAYSFTFQGTGLKTITYLCDPQEYLITYNLDGGINSTNNPSIYTVESNFDLSEASKTGYSFLGWFDNSGKKIESIYKGTTGNIVLTARWEIKLYDVTYLDDDGTVLYKTSFTYFDDIPEFAGTIPTRQSDEEYDYGFAKWELIDSTDGNYIYQAKYDKKSRYLDIYDNRVRGFDTHSLAPENVYIPHYWNGKEITKIVSDAFRYDENIKSISIPSSINEIGYDDTTLLNGGSFEGCVNLEKFILYEGSDYLSVEYDALYSKDKEILISVPKSKTNFDINENTKIISISAFDSCSKIQNINIPKNIVEIDDSFDKMDSFTTITVDANNSKFKVVDGILYDNSITKLITAPYGIKGEVTLQEGIKNISQLRIPYASVLNIPSTVTYIDIGWANSNSFNSIESFNVDKENKYYHSIDGVLFEKYTDRNGNILSLKLIIYPSKKTVTNYIIPEQTSMIREYSFIGEKPSEITIPKSIKNINSSWIVFNHSKETLDGPVKINFSGTLAEWNSIVSSLNKDWSRELYDHLVSLVWINYIHPREEGEEPVDSGTIEELLVKYYGDYLFVHCIDGNADLIAY